MASIVITTRHDSPKIPQDGPLSDGPTEWPTDARSAYRQVLSELDSWCRTHDSSVKFNSWVAEEAIRRSW